MRKGEKAAQKLNRIIPHSLPLFALNLKSIDSNLPRSFSAICSLRRRSTRPAAGLPLPAGGRGTDAGRCGALRRNAGLAPPSEA